MDKLKSSAQYFYNHHFVRYLFVGGSTFIIDFGLLVLLHGKLNVRLPIATSISYWTSVAFNFTLNRWWTFSASESKKLHKHMLAYAILLGFNYTFTVIFVSLGSHVVSYEVAKLLAVLIQTSWTFLIYKNIIFKTDAADKLTNL